MTALKLLQQYDKGVYTLLEVVNLLIEEHSLADIRTLPKEWQDRVLEELRKSPTTDEDWSNEVYILPWCGSGKGPSQEELLARSRKAIEALRKELADEECRVRRTAD